MCRMCWAYLKIVNPLRISKAYLSQKVCTSIIYIFKIELLATEPLSVDQHLKVVRETTWEARANWQCLGEELKVTMGKLQVKKIM